MTLKFSSMALATLALVGCGGSDDTASVLYKPTGTLQCTATQTTQARLDTEVVSLQGAGAFVIASNCANDGEAHVTLCGAENGDLFSVTVPPSSESLARQLGYQSASQYSSTRPIACQ